MEEKIYNEYREILNKIKEDSMDFYRERYVEIFVRDDVDYLSNYIIEVTLVISGDNVPFKDGERFSKIVAKHDPNWEIFSDVICKRTKKVDHILFTSAKVI